MLHNGESYTPKQTLGSFVVAEQENGGKSGRNITAVFNRDGTLIAGPFNADCRLVNHFCTILAETNQCGKGWSRYAYAIGPAS